MTPAHAALAGDTEDLCALLSVLADAAAQRGDEDTRRTLRVAARYAEGIAERLEQLELPAAAGPAMCNLGGDHVA